MSTELVKSIRSSPTYKTFYQIAQNVRNGINLEKAQQDAVNIHNSRVLREIKGEAKYSPKTLIDANLSDLSYRSTLVDMRVRLDIKLSTLREALDAIRGHIATKYAVELKDFTTIDQRKAFIERVVRTSTTFLAEGDALISAIDTYVKDIDQSNYHYKNIIACLQLLDSSKTGVTV